MLRLFLFFLLFSSISFVINANEKLKAVATSHKLLQYQENGQIKGPSADIFKLLMAEAKLANSIEFYPWSRAYKIAETRPNTMILSMVRTKYREDKFYWLTKVSELVRAFISLKIKPENFVKNIELAQRKVVAVVRDSYSYNSLIKQGFSEDKNLYVVTRIEHAISLFEKGKVDLIYTDPTVMINYYAALNKNSDKLVNFFTLPETRRESYIAINRSSDLLLVKKLKQAAKKIKTLDSYQHFLKFKPLIDQK